MASRGPWPAWQHSRTDRLEAAVRDLREAARDRRFAANPDVLYALAASHHGLGDAAQPLPHLERVRGQKPDEADAPWLQALSAPPVQVVWTVVA